MLKKSRIQIRVTEKEFELFKHFAKVNKLSITEYILQKCLGFKVEYKEYKKEKKGWFMTLKEIAKMNLLYAFMNNLITFKEYINALNKLED